MMSDMHTWLVALRLSNLRYIIDHVKVMLFSIRIKLASYKQNDKDRYTYSKDDDSWKLLEEQLHLLKMTKQGAENSN